MKHGIHLVIYYCENLYVTLEVENWGSGYQVDQGNTGYTDWDHEIFIPVLIVFNFLEFTDEICIKGKMFKCTSYYRVAYEYGRA